MSLIEDIETVVGVAGCVTDPKILEQHCQEWRKRIFGKTRLLVLPANVAEVSAVVKIAARHGVAIVPQGGNTGMCGGAVPDASGDQIILSLAGLKRIRRLDADNFSIEVEAGCLLSDVQQVALDADRFFPLSLSAEGSCQIGGNLATNAGGVNVLRYGVARDQVLGLEVVLASGEIINGLRSVRKDNAGYDLKHLFIGSEGTLGIITAAALKLYPRHRYRQSILMAIPSSDAAVKILSQLRSGLGEVIDAFELISSVVVDLLKQHIPTVSFPLETHHPWYILMEIADNQLPSGHLKIDDQLQQLMDDGLLIDAVMAKNTREAEALWRMRHAIAEAERLEGPALKHDIAVPVSLIPTFLRDAGVAIKRIDKAARIIVFGHVGDGNLHFNVMPSREGRVADSISSAVYGLVSELGGSVCAEHGVGVAKRELLSEYKSPSEVAVMKSLKNTLDPLNLLNPGKVI